MKVKTITGLTLINAHGDNHGLFVEVDTWNHLVDIGQWWEANDPDEDGVWRSYLEHVQVKLAELLDPKQPHMESVNPHTSQTQRVIQAALAYLSHWGGGTDGIDDTTGEYPCGYFEHDPKVKCHRCTEGGA
jgi:hypothetical protein